MLDKDDVKTNETDYINNFKITIMTWNLWSIFVSSPRCLTNPQRCSDYILTNIANKNNWTQYDGLIVCGFQELWKWNTGIIPPILLSHFIYIFEYIPYLGTIISRIFQLITLVLGAIPIFKLFSFFHYCPKQLVINKFNKILKYNYHSNNVPTFPIYKVADNGLLLLFNNKPDICGYENFINSHGECSLVNKGFLYAYFNKYNILFVMTHMQYTGHKHFKIKQLNQIVTFLNSFQKNNGKNNMKIIVFGDFNCDLNPNNEKMAENENINPLTLLGTEYSKVNSCSPTTWDNKSIDHIFVNHRFTKCNETIGGNNGQLSDHYCVINEFISH
eukprot:467350_1